MTRRGAIASLFGGAALFLTGCRALFGTTARLRYRITITFDTPDGVKSGSAVQEIMLYDPIEAIKPVNVGTTEITGDAVVILVRGTPYFVGLNLCIKLLNDAIAIGEMNPPLTEVNGGRAQMLNAFKQANAQTVMDGRRYLSLPNRSFSLIKFSNESDYSTLDSIRFNEDDQAWAFRTVVVSTTNDQITRQAMTLLPWLGTLSRESVRKNPKDDGYLIIRLENLSDKFGAVK